MTALTSIAARRAVFLDRDGVINRNREDHVKSWEEFERLPGVLGAFRCLAHSELLVVVVSNQSAIGRGLTTSERVDDINSRMISAVHRVGGRIDAVYYCPHTPESGCSCRKPKPGLLQRAAEELEIDLSRSYLVGDQQSDMEAALAAGCKRILVGEITPGRHTQEAASDRSFARASCLNAAVDLILVEAERR